ncbi:MAG: polyprenyl synthetase family protein [Fimbriimonadaceae bacterium]
MPGELILQQFREQVDTRLSELLSPADLTPSELHSAMRYSALAPGKRLRPGMTIAAAQAVGALPEIALDAGCATELVHCFSLIHDDLPAIDNDDLRRGRATCHKIYGEAMAILAGDALFALAFEVVSLCNPDPAKTAACVRALAHSTGSHGLVGGEVLDILSEGVEGDMALLQTIHARKTGALLGACCEIGGILGGANGDLWVVLREFGQKVGLAFQVADDVLNETSTAEQLGKAVGSDSELNKLTYPRLIGLEQSKTLANTIVSEACELLTPFGDAAANLRGLADYAVQRDW